MIASGDFPDLGAPTGPRRGAPRASDGLIRLDVDGITTFASPNALSAFNRMGFDDELEGESLAEVTTRLLSGKLVVDESLPLVVTGRAPWRTDVESRGVTVSLRAIPIRHRGERIGAIVLSRDVTELRHQEQELITKDATIREIHHRVKNNLQTVASLLRIQARRTHSDEAREALTQAMRRVGAIAVVHDTLSEGLAQNVDFDEVFDRALLLVAEVASAHNTTAHPKRSGSFGVLPSEYATPLALALTELVTNAVEHGLAGQEGDVEITADRSHDDAHRAGARHRLGPARGQGRRGPRHADRAHPHPGRTRRHDRLAHGRRSRHRGDDRRAAALDRARARACGCRATAALRIAAFRCGSGSAACASGAALQGATLVFAEAAPHARVLTGLEGVLEADLGDGAPGADGLGLLDLVDGGTSVADREEEFRVCGEAGGLVAPIHGDAPCCTSFADAHDCACRIRLLQGESRISGSRIMTDRLTSL